MKALARAIGGWLLRWSGPSLQQQIDTINVVIDALEKRMSRGLIIDPEWKARIDAHLDADALKRGIGK